MYCSPTTCRTVPDCESTMGASASIVIEVCAEATGIAMRMEAGTSASRLIPCCRTDVKPSAATNKSYRPGGTRLNWNRPCESVVVWRGPAGTGVGRVRFGVGDDQPGGGGHLPGKQAG